MAKIVVKTGDLLDATADIVVSTANPWLKMSGGVNGAILLRGGEAIQQELRTYLRGLGKAAVEPGTVVVTCPGPLNAKHLLHAVAIDPFYDSSVLLVQQTVESALRTAQRLKATTVAMPALATGYGRLSMEQFAEGLAAATGTDWSPVAELVVVVQPPENADIIRRYLKGRRDTTE
jgi:O-acetyl-ADP-ribose deacetylase (regulator of RNase III)